MRNVTFCAAKGMLLPCKTIPFTFNVEMKPHAHLLILPRTTIPFARLHLLFHVHIRFRKDLIRKNFAHFHFLFRPQHLTFLTAKAPAHRLPQQPLPAKKRKQSHSASTTRLPYQSYKFTQNEVLKS